MLIKNILYFLNDSNIILYLLISINFLTPMFLFNFNCLKKSFLKNCVSINYIMMINISIIFEISNILTKIYNEFINS